MRLSRKTNFWLAAALLATNSMMAAVAGTQITESSSAIASETRQVEASVTGVNLNGSINLKLKQGSTPALTIHAERRLLPNIATARDGDTLRIETRGGFSSSHPATVEMTLPALRQLQVMGSGDSEVSGFSGDRLKLGIFGSGNVSFSGQYQNVGANLHGSGSLKLGAGTSERIELGLFGSGNISASGKSKALNAKLAGSGDLDARQLQAETATISVFGTGDASIHATRTVAVSSRGTGDVDVYGKPAQRAVSTSGTGTVRWQ
jgi:hypothetical protein